MKREKRHNRSVSDSSALQNFDFSSGEGRNQQTLAPAAPLAPYDDVGKRPASTACFLT